MRRLLRFVWLSSLLCLTAVVPASAQKKITASEAKEHYGETATVCGAVVSARFADTTTRQPTFLNLDRPYPNQVFTIVIWGDNRSKFGKPEDEFNGKRICVTGKITAYAGLPEIVAEDPKQLRLDTEK